MLSKIKSFVRISILILALILSISLIRSITKIAGSGEKITNAEDAVNSLKKEHDNLVRELQAEEQTRFIESEARDKLGLAKKGEIVVVLPDTDTLKSLSPKMLKENYSLPTPTWKKWLNLFL